MKNKAALLKKRFGFDLREARAFRTTATLIPSTGAPKGLAATPSEALAMINASPHVKTTLADADVHTHTIEAASNRFIADRYAFLGLKTLQNMAEDARNGFAILTRHATGGGFAGDGENPYGRTFAGSFEQRNDGVARVLVQFYMLTNHSPNGANAPSTDDLHRGLVGGTLFDVSAGLAFGGDDLMLCDVCGRDLFSAECKHVPGTVHEMTAAEIAKQSARGVPKGCATYTMEGWRTGEVSIVYNGAVPHAGTAFAAGSLSTELPGDEEPAEENTMKYSAEAKLLIGLKADATDAEYEARIAQLKSSETDLAAARTQATATFEATYKDKLPAEVIAGLKDSPNRETLAQAFLKNAEAAQPTVGGMAGAAAAAAATQMPATETTKAGEASKFLREGFGMFDTEEKLNAASLTSPTQAVAKLFGIRATETMHDRQVVEYRKNIFGIATA